MASDSRKIDLGTPDITLGGEAVTPTLEIGSITPEGVTFVGEREVQEILTGSPKRISALFDTKHTYMISWKSYEWSLRDQITINGSGVYTENILLSPGVMGNRYEWGGSACVAYASCFMEKGGCQGGGLFFYFWKIASTAAIDLALGSDDAHMFTYDFKGIESAYDWEGNDLPSGGSMFRIERGY